MNIRKRYEQAMREQNNLGKTQPPEWDDIENLLDVINTVRECLMNFETSRKELLGEAMTFIEELDKEDIQCTKCNKELDTYEGWEQDSKGRKWCHDCRMAVLDTYDI